jgi:hypothetical protein
MAIKNSGIESPVIRRACSAWPIAAIASALAFLADRGRFGAIVRAGFWALPLRGRSVVVLQEAAKTLTTDDVVAAYHPRASRKDRQVAQALMVALRVIVRFEFANRCPSPKRSRGRRRVIGTVSRPDGAMIESSRREMGLLRVLGGPNVRDGDEREFRAAR